MSDSVPLSTEVKCSRCEESYELGDFYLQDAEPLPWLVNLETVSSVEAALATAVCQQCHGYQPGISLLDAIKSLGVETTAAPRLLTRQEVGARAAERYQRQQILGVKPEIMPRPFIGSARPPVQSRVEIAGNRPSIQGRVEISGNRTQVHGRVEINTHRPQAQSRVEIGAKAPASSNREIIGAADPRPADRPIVLGARPRVENRTIINPAVAGAMAGKPDSPREPVQRAPRVVRPLTAKLDMENQAKLKKIAEAIVAEAAAALEEQRQAQAEALEAQNAELKAEADAIEASRLEHLKMFMTAIRQAKGLLTRARNKAAQGLDPSSLLDSLDLQLDKALVVDAERRDRDALLRMVGTKACELVELGAFCFTETTAIPGPYDTIAGTKVAVANPDGSIAKAVPRTKRVVPRQSKLPKPNTPIKQAGVGGSVPALHPTIRYPEGEMYGDNPFLVFPDDRHRFQECVTIGDEPELFMGKGQRAYMEYVKDFGWGYAPLNDDASKKPLDFRFGSFERGFVHPQRMPVITFVTIVNGIALGASLSRLSTAFPVKTPFDNAMKSDHNIVVLNEIDDPSLNEPPPAPRRRRPTTTQCVVLQ